MKLAFRVYNKIRKIMSYFDSPWLCGEYQSLCFSVKEEQKSKYSLDIDTISEEDIVIMQSTGLFDKNRKEIYEGDILAPVRNTGYKEPPKGLFCQVVWDEDWVSFKGLKDNKRDGEYVLTKGNATKHWEIIGNIYETPELLNKK